MAAGVAVRIPRAADKDQPSIPQRVGGSLPPFPSARPQRKANFSLCLECAAESPQQPGRLFCTGDLRGHPKLAIGF